MSTHSIDGAVAMVTGSSSGIGRAVSLRLGRLGATVIAVSRRLDAVEGVADEIRMNGGRAHAMAVDVADLDAVRAAVASVVDRHLRLDIVVCSAGTAILGSFLDIPPGAWQTMIETNVSGFVNTAHTALPHLIDAAASGPRRVADLVAISSTSGRRPLAGNNVYGATKHAVTALSEALRQDVTERRVRVGVIAPGMVATPMTETYADSSGFRFLTDEDVADAVEYMVTRPPDAAINEIVLRSTGQAV